MVLIDSIIDFIYYSYYYTCVQNSLDQPLPPKGRTLHDCIDNAKYNTDKLTEDALRRASLAAHEPHEQTLIWVDRSGGEYEYTFTGTCQDRLAYIDEHRIDELPFAFAYMANGRQFVSGNDAKLRGILEQRAQLA